MKPRYIILLAGLLFTFLKVEAAPQLLENKERILFLGDSITQAGDYVTYFDAWLVTRFPDRRFTVLNAGLSSETVSGLSPEGHAGGRFPMPCLFERLERVLALTKPDLMIACYGMNCGIYRKLDEARFARYRHGMLRLRAAARQYGAEIIHLTPPIYDKQGKPGFDYDSVLTAYSEWLVSQRAEGWHVADLHSEMKTKIRQARAEDPHFRVQKDKVHPDQLGHWMMAQTLINYFGDSTTAQLRSPDLLADSSKLKAIKERWLVYLQAVNAETKPFRPNVPQAGSFELAEENAKKLEAIIYEN